MRVRIARIGKPHGIRGEVTVQLFTDDPQTRCAPGQVLLLDPSGPQAAALAPTGTLEIRSARWNKSVLVLGFTTVPDRNGAEALRGSHLSAEAAEDPEGDAWYEHELVGLPVHLLAVGADPDDDEIVPGERVGTVSGLRTLPVQDLLEVELADGGEADIPFVEQIVLAVDQEAGMVVIDPPPGLLELSAGDDASDQDPEPAA